MTATVPGVDFRGAVLLAPLTKGGNLPFRRWCVDAGAKVTVSEMAYARQVVRGSRSELALLRRHPSEECFGVQLASNKAPDAIEAAKRAIEDGARFVDINAGCPIHDVVRRGMGATLLQRPAALARMVEAMTAALDIPVTVKIRTGWKEEKLNAPEVARQVEEAGAAAVAIHGRTREQRYSRAANWDMIGEIAAERTVPVIGNGDILTWYEAEDRLERSGCAGLMLGRGALIKPWLFREIEERRDILPTVEERLADLLRFVRYLKEHFRDDEKGRTRVMRFLPWHMSFFARYRPLPAERFRDLAREHPLMQTRVDSGDVVPDPPRDKVDALLRDHRDEAHVLVAEALWESVQLQEEFEDVEAAFERLSQASATLDREVGAAGAEFAGDVPTAHG